MLIFNCRIDVIMNVLILVNWMKNFEEWHFIEKNIKYKSLYKFVILIEMIDVNLFKESFHILQFLEIL